MRRMTVFGMLVAASSFTACGKPAPAPEAAAVSDAPPASVDAPGAASPADSASPVDAPSAVSAADAPSPVTP